MIRRQCAHAALVYHPRLGVDLHKPLTNFVPADRFADYLTAMRDAIGRGEFDDEIAAALHGSANVSGIAQVPLPPMRDSDPDQVRHEQRVDALRNEGRNPDGSLTAVTRND